MPRSRRREFTEQSYKNHENYRKLRNQNCISGNASASTFQHEASPAHVTQPMRRLVRACLARDLTSSTVGGEALTSLTGENPGIAGHCLGTMQYQPSGKEQDANNTFKINLLPNSRSKAKKNLHF